jgi:hypothetical protein
MTVLLSNAGQKSLSVILLSGIHCKDNNFNNLLQLQFTFAYLSLNLTTVEAASCDYFGPALKPLTLAD